MIEGSVIGAGTTVGEFAVIRDAIVGEGVEIGAEATLGTGAVVGDRAVIGAGAAVDSEEPVPTGGEVSGPGEAG